MAHHIIGMVNDQEHAADITEKLKTAHIASEKISVLFADKSESHNFALENKIKVPGDLSAGTDAGGILGGVEEWFLGTAAVPDKGLLDDEVRLYEDKIQKGNILILVQAENNDQQGDVRKILEDSGVRDISATGRSSGMSKEGEEQPKIKKDKSTTSTTSPDDPEIPGKEEPRV